MRTGGRRVLFVCTGNTCRSPMAESLFRRSPGTSRMDWEVRSCGLSAWSGDEASAGALTVLKRRGADISLHRSTRMSLWLADWATDIFPMTRSHFLRLHSEYPDASGKVGMFTDCLPGAGRGRDVDDPFGGGEADYERVACLMEEAVPFLIRFLEARDRLGESPGL